MTADAERATPDDRRRAKSVAIVEASLDDLRSDDVRFLQEAAGRGRLHVRVPSDEMVAHTTGSPPRFPAAERLFLAESLRWVERASIVERPVADELPTLAAPGVTLVGREDEDRCSQGRRARRWRALPRGVPRGACGVPHRRSRATTI